MTSVLRNRVRLSSASQFKAPTGPYFFCFESRKGIQVFAQAVVVICSLGCIIVFYEVIFHSDRLSTKDYIDISLMILPFIGLFLHGSLLYGASIESGYWLTPWLVVAGIGLLTATISCIAFAFTDPIWLSGLLVVFVLGYMWVCIFSYYQSLKSPPLCTKTPSKTSMDVTSNPTSQILVESKAPQYDSLSQATTATVQIAITEH